MTSPFAVPEAEKLDATSLALEQSARLATLLSAVDGHNRFYARKWAEAGVSTASIGSVADLGRLPFTTKAELVADQLAHGPWGTNLTEPLDRYTRYCQTSSTTGRPLRWCDTNETWQWLLDCWKNVFRAAHVGAGDRIVFPFSFGPFLGFWAAFDAASQIGAHVIPAGGMSSHLRLSLIETLGATVVCCTPTYALRLAEVAGTERALGRPPLAAGAVRVMIVAGEPGGSIPATRDLIQSSWGARVIDHHGLTETGPVSTECWERPGGLHVFERDFIVEVIDPKTTSPVADGTPGELVLTNLGRVASPVIRYRTGDLVVRHRGVCACGRTTARLEGGILSRADDMVTVRGVNVYPAAVESVVRQFPEVVEFRSTVGHVGALLSLSVDLELAAGARMPADVEARVSQAFRDALGLTVLVRVVEPGTLPRFEMKAQRFIVER
jgi:phenylacetate-CoA ligase